jgi:glucokinase
MSGEIGHAVVDPLGPVCKCGGRGCLEAVAAGPAIQARGASIANLPPEAAAGEAQALAGQAPAAAVFEAAACGDQSAREIIQEICKYLGLATQWLIMAFDPQLIVLAGGVTQTGQPFLDAVNRQLVSLAEDSFVFREVLAQTSVQLSKLGQDAGVLGAAALAAEATTPGDEA